MKTPRRWLWLVLLFVVQLAFISYNVVFWSVAKAYGTPIKILCNLVDPLDAFRGRYVMLNVDTSALVFTGRTSRSDPSKPNEPNAVFTSAYLAPSNSPTEAEYDPTATTNDSAASNKMSILMASSTVYVTLEPLPDMPEFYRLRNVSIDPPKQGVNFFKTTLLYAYYPDSSDNQNIPIVIPFGRYYMNEADAPLAEQLVRQQLSKNLLKPESTPDKQSRVYIQANLYHDRIVTTNLMIGSQSISDLVHQSPIDTLD
jgi:GDYXXLXY protein